VLTWFSYCTKNNHNSALLRAFLCKLSFSFPPLPFSIAFDVCEVLSQQCPLIQLSNSKDYEKTYHKAFGKLHYNPQQFFIVRHVRLLCKRIFQGLIQSCQQL
jgi:hypothetical protein